MKKRGRTPQIIFFILMLICTVLVVLLSEAIYDLQHHEEGESAAEFIGIIPLMAIGIIPALCEIGFGLVSIGFSINGIKQRRLVFSIITLLISIACVAYVPIFLIIL